MADALRRLNKMKGDCLIIPKKTFLTQFFMFFSMLIAEISFIVAFQKYPNEAYQCFYIYLTVSILFMISMMSFLFMLLTIAK